MSVTDSFRGSLRAIPSFLVLVIARLFSVLFYRFEASVLDDSEQPIDWNDLRVVAVLNHTSLFEWLYLGAVPLRFAWKAANSAVVPVADKTLARPLVGPLFRLLTKDVISVTREPDATWQAVLDKARPGNMIVIFPEGRMMRANGLDKNGQPMTVRGGIADILAATDGGKMLIAYSGGLHHVQIPGQRLPRLFKTLRIGFQQVDIRSYKEAFEGEPGSIEFKQAVKEDLQRRRDQYC